jgi:hypothetical protein
MSFKARSGAELQAARKAATERFLAIAEAIKAEAGVVHHRVIGGLWGCACPALGIVHAPKGRTRKQLYILAHECGHVALNHDSTKPCHVKEHEAERWAHAALRRHGVAVPRAMTRRAKGYVGDKILQAVRSGTNHIDTDAARFARQSVTKVRRYVKFMRALVETRAIARMNRPRMRLIANAQRKGDRHGHT